MQADLSAQRKRAFQNAGVETKLATPLLKEGTPAVKDLGKRLRTARQKAGLKQEQAGEKLGLTSHSAIGQWERGEVLVETINLILATQLYGGSLDWLVFGQMSGLESRIAALPDSLREGTMEQVTVAIESAERLARRNPSVFSDKVIHDTDPRLTVWSAKDKPKRLPAKPKSKK